MKKIYFLLYLSSIIVMMSGCATLQGGTSSAWLKPRVKVDLPQPTISPEIHAQQLLTATYRHQKQSLLVMLDADQSSLELVGLSSVGIKLFKVIYDDKGIHVEQYMSLPQLPQANQVLADIMFSYWPKEAWQSVLPQGWHIADSELQRDVYDEKGVLIIHIDYMKSAEGREPTALTHQIFGYQVQIQTLG